MVTAEIYKLYSADALQVMNKTCERATPPLQLAMFRHRCVASCRKKLPRVTWP